MGARDDILRNAPPEAREDAGFANWLMGRVVRLSAAGVSLEGIKTLVQQAASLYDKWKNGRVTIASRDGVGSFPPEDNGGPGDVLPPFNDPPPIGDPRKNNEKRAIYFGMTPTKPHCKRHIYTDA